MFFLFTNSSKCLRINSRSSLCVIAVLLFTGSILYCSSVRGLCAKLICILRQKLFHCFRRAPQKFLQQSVSISAFSIQVILLQIQQCCYQPLRHALLQHCFFLRFHRNVHVFHFAPRNLGNFPRQLCVIDRFPPVQLISLSRVFPPSPRPGRHHRNIPHMQNTV